MNERQKKLLDEAPVSAKGILQRAFEKQASPRSAIKAFCLHCLGYSRADVTNCTSLGCPLYSYRPYQTADEPDEPEAISPPKP